MKNYSTIDAYLEELPKHSQKGLESIRSLVKKCAPDAVETISYGIPTFKLNGKNLIHFATFKDHIGLYPGSEAIEVFKNKLKDYDISKGTIRFPINEPLPLDLIKEIAQYRISCLQKT